jgi:hypothetical protein
MFVYVIDIRRYPLLRVIHREIPFIVKLPIKLNARIRKYFIQANENEINRVFAKIHESAILYKHIYIHI